MNFAKKTASIVLAGVMAVSSLFVGMTASAAAPAFTPTAASGQAFAAINPVIEKGEYGYEVKNDTSYFSFTPSVTGNYALCVDTSPLYRTYDSTSGKYVFSTVSGEKRVDGAYVSIYDSQYLDGEDWVTATYPTVEETKYVYDEKVGDVVEDIASLRYISGFSTATLTAGHTYYIEAIADVFYNTSYNYIYDEANDKYIEKAEFSDITSSQCCFSIVPFDYECGFSFVYDSFDVAVPADYDGYYEYSVDGNGNKYVSISALSDYNVHIKYAGSAKDVVVPETINGAKVKEIYGTSNASITSVTVPGTVKTVEGFSDLKSLKAVNLNSGTKVIGSFENDSALTSITIPETVKEIPYDAFKNCTSLSSVTLKEGTQSIGSYAFYNTAVKGIVVPASVVKIGVYALGYYQGLNLNTVDPYDTTAVAVSNFAIGGRSSEEAARYAAQNGMGYYDMTTGCPHPYNTKTVNSTLFAYGKKTSVCPLCGNVSTKSISKKTFKISSVKSSKKKTIVVKAPKQSGITGYQIQYSTSSKFTKKTTKTVTVKTTKALSKTISGLRSGKKYYVRVRATGKTSSGKTAYSKYTPTKSVKVK
ncbi:MAG: leucine-rich repeat domain-containing protein [Eubacteriales bacterium]|nr:leucine-rich repeat domain-containing protein [Eubacteriales bacterium]